MYPVAPYLHQPKEKSPRYRHIWDTSESKTPVFMGPEGFSMNAAEPSTNRTWVLFLLGYKIQLRNWLNSNIRKRLEKFRFAISPKIIIADEVNEIPGDTTNEVQHEYT